MDLTIALLRLKEFYGWSKQPKNAPKYNSISKKFHYVLSRIWLHFQDARLKEQAFAKKRTSTRSSSGEIVHQVPFEVTSTYFYSLISGTLEF